MEEIELTFRLENTREEIEEILKKDEFKFVKKYTVRDIYMCLDCVDIINTKNRDILKDSIIIRSAEDKVAVIYKKKIYDEKGSTIYRERYDMGVDNVDNALKIFKNIGYKELITMTDSISEYKYKNTKLFLEEVDDLGSFLEIELDAGNSKDSFLEQAVYNLRRSEFKFNEKLFDVKKAEEMINFKYKKNEE